MAMKLQGMLKTKNSCEIVHFYIMVTLFSVILCSKIFYIIVVSVVAL